jgi:cobalt-zinc-cadmium efflux system protein
MTLALVLLYMGAEVVGGLLTNSLALLADAGHMFSDAGSLALALFAMWIARKPRSPGKTFGYHRTEVLAALANGLTLVVIAVYIVFEAVERFESPQEVDGATMMWIAVGGLVVNLLGLKILHGGQDESLNLRGAWLHVMADALGSVQAIAAGALIWAFGWDIADPIASVLIALLVFGSSWPLLRDATNVLLEGTPAHIDSGEVTKALEAVDGVLGIHDLHIWTITSGFESLSVHVRVKGREGADVLAEIRELVRERFDIEHSTVQVEGEEGCGEPTCD